MANDVIPTAYTLSATTNGTPSVESVLERAIRILRGDIEPDDYLMVPEDIIAFVDGAEARTGIKLLPEYRRKMIAQLALQHHHPGDEVLVRHTPDGVIVMAFGSDRVASLLERLTLEQAALVNVEFPPTLL